MNDTHGYPAEVERVLSERIRHSKDLFVFPSEIVAESWQLRLLETGAVRALRRGRFLSWDRLKERYFSPYLSSRPANLMLRTLFTSGLLDVRERDGFPFRELVNPEYPEQAPRFTRWISGLLPQIKRARSVLSQEAPPSSGISDGYIHDIEHLYAEYSRFLSDYGLFEPSWQEPDRREHEGTIHLFFPELIEDFDEYRELLTEDAGYVVHSMEGEDGEGTKERGIFGGPGIYRFDSAWEELEYALDRISRLLQAGTAPSDITITLPAYDAWMPYLDEAARLRGIPLHFRSGSTLTSYPVGRLFRALKELEESGFSHSSMKNLFLDPAYPWRRRDQWRKMLSFGVEHSCIRTYTGPRGKVDPWRSKLKKAGEERLSGLYDTFVRELRSLLGSTSLAELNRSIVGFLTSFFDDEAWGSEERKVLQYALMQLRELADAEEYLERVRAGGDDGRRRDGGRRGDDGGDRSGGEEVGSGGDGGDSGSWVPRDPYATWLSILDQRLYVPTIEGAGISVYRYRVAAGSYPRYHFVLGAGQEETRCLFDSLSFLREDRRGSIEGGSSDLSTPFLRAYTRSGAEVFCSCSDEGFGGPQLPPAEFLSPDSPFFGGVEQASAAGLDDPYRREREGWYGSIEPPGRLLPLQVEGYRRMRATGLSPKGVDYTDSLMGGDHLREALFRIIKKEDGLFHFSPRGIDIYRGCGYAYYLQYALGVEEEDYEPSYENRLVAGKVIHRALQLLFEEIMADGGHFDPAGRDKYVELARSAAGRSVGEYERRGLDLFPPEWRRLAAFLEEQLERFVDVEAESFPNFTVEETEERHEREFPEKGVALYGWIDRMSSINGRAAVVDYKSGEAPPKKRVEAKEGPPDQSQMPVYLLLAEKNRREAAAVSYYSVRNAAYSHLMYDGPAPVRELIGSEALHEAAQKVVDEAGRIRADMERGDYRVPDVCEPCVFRAVCRVKYSIRTIHTQAERR